MLSEERERLLQEYNKKQEERTAVYVAAASHARQPVIPMKNVAEEGFLKTPLSEQKTSFNKTKTFFPQSTQCSPSSPLTPVKTKPPEQKPSFVNTNASLPQSSERPEQKPASNNTHSFFSPPAKNYIYDPDFLSGSFDKRICSFDDDPSRELNDGEYVSIVGANITRIGFIVMKLSAILLCYPLFFTGVAISAIGLIIMGVGLYMDYKDISLFNREKNSDIEMDSTRAMSCA